MERSMQRVEDFPINVCAACGESRQEERVKKTGQKYIHKYEGEKRVGKRASSANFH